MSLFFKKTRPVSKGSSVLHLSIVHVKDSVAISCRRMFFKMIASVVAVHFKRPLLFR